MKSALPILLLSLISWPLGAMVITGLDNFTSFPNRFVADIGNTSQFPLPLGGDNIVGPFTVGGVTITSGNAPFINGLYFASAATSGGHETNSPDLPGNDAGAIISNNTGFFQMALPNLVLNFSQPIAGFGTTFLHDVSGQPQQLDAHGPATVTIFSGLNGTGTVLGSASDFGGGDVLDFIGLLSDMPNIQSAVLSSSGPFSAFQADAYGLSVAPVQQSAVPEPISLELVALGFLALVSTAPLAGRAKQ